MKSAFAVLFWFAASILASELLGYLLHRLLHSGKIGFLSRSHMRHHLVLYGPLQSQRPGTSYRVATTDAIALGNIGLEWLVPGALLLVASVTVLQFLRVSMLHQTIFVAGSLAWSFLMFSYLHDRMHIDDFWMERAPCLKRWFVSAREAHDIHHWALNNDGLMDKNFGIAFFFFDRIFGTWTGRWPSFNRRGYANALHRFSDVLEPPRPNHQATPPHPISSPVRVRFDRGACSELPHSAISVALSPRPLRFKTLLFFRTQCSDSDSVLATLRSPRENSQ